MQPYFAPYFIISAAMFAANAVRRAATAAVRRESRRNVSAYNDVVAAPPSNKVTVTEQVIQGIVLSAGVLAYPVYAMFEVAEHKRAEYAEMEVPEEWEEWRAKQKK
ncbi:hypothetical protein FOCC_FOCC004809 [Frankliniella occidentalis]|nr:hypothetical protein FOCC_FOCC004809 [Frankliniella occidentalis]